MLVLSIQNIKPHPEKLDNSINVRINKAGIQAGNSTNTCVTFHGISSPHN